MELTNERKLYIDSLNYETLLSKVRFSPVGDPWFQDETGTYWMKKMSELRHNMNNDDHVAASKRIGWDK